MILGGNKRACQSSQVLHLAGCDAMTLSPALLNELASKPAAGAEIRRRLSPEAAAARREERRHGQQAGSEEVPRVRSKADFDRHVQARARGGA